MIRKRLRRQEITRVELFSALINGQSVLPAVCDEQKQFQFQQVCGWRMHAAGEYEAVPQLPAVSGDGVSDFFGRAIPQPASDAIRAG